jgi:hypothetical protein
VDIEDTKRGAVDLHDRQQVLQEIPDSNLDLKVFQPRDAAKKNSNSLNVVLGLCPRFSCVA